MQNPICAAILIFLGGCATHAPRENIPREPESTKAAALDFQHLQTALGMDRVPQELGLQEKLFDSCRLKFRDISGKCGPRYLSVLNFRLACRDSEGTVEEVVTNTRPLVSDRVEYQLAGIHGFLKSDDEGIVQLKVVTTAPVRGQRLVITVGRQFFGKEISEVEQIVLPTYWCP